MIFKRALCSRVLLVLAILVAGWPAVTYACPFCSALPRTLSDDLEESTAVVFARCETRSHEGEGFWVYQMRIADVVKGDPALKNSLVEVASLEELSEDAVFWLVGFGQTQLQWGKPKKISSQGVSYVRGLSGLPDRGPRRLEHFLGFLQHADELVASDAYNEFAEASLADIVSLRDKLDRQWVITQLREESVPLHRRRLCWTFLSQCGITEDTKLFDEAIERRRVDPMFRPGMDAAISCFITLGGQPALARIERDYLANPDAEYLDCFAAVSAIRVHGTEIKLIPRERLAAAMRHVLRSPELADLVIPDLARWEDWSAIDRMVELFKTSTEETSFLKPATVRYLKACPLPTAAVALDKLREIDAPAVQAAENSMLFHSGLATVPVPPPETDESAPPNAETVAPASFEQIGSNDKPTRSTR